MVETDGVTKDVEKTVAGYYLFLVHGKAGALMARKSQLWTSILDKTVMVRRMWPIRNLKTSSTKTAKSEELKRTSPHFTYTWTSLSAGPWWESWIGGRRKLGLPVIPERAFDSSKSAPVMPFANVEGKVAPADDVL